jgi:cytochrome c-type biogenesis protein CcmF
VESTRGWILMAWVFLSLGLLLGARWAYEVLDWGGYWGWDPVENAGLLPWLTVTALLHSGRKRGLRAWSVVLAALSFGFVLFGAFATRGGMIESVHSFTASNLGVAFLVALVITALATIMLLIARRHSVRDPEGPPEQILSPTGTSFLTVLILLAIVVTVLVGSLLPTLTQALGRQALRASSAWFDRVTAPLFASLILVMGICSWLGRRDAAALFSDIRHSWSHLGVPWIAAVATPIAARAAGFSGAVPLISLGLLAWAGATVSTKLMRHFIQEAHRPGRALWRRLPAIAQRQHRRWGAAIIHLGIVIMGFGVVGTRTQATEAQINLAPGQSAAVSGYTIAYESYAQDLGTDTLATQARLSIYRHQTLVAWMMPTLRTYVGYEQTVSTPAVLPRFREDLYVTLAGWQPKEQLATLKVFVNPLASFIWVGGALLLVGGLVAAWPDRSLRQTARAKAVFIPLALTLVLAILGSVLWRTGDTVSRPVSRRPDRGQTAPGFRLSTLDGQTMTLPSLRGQVVIVAFWATWCPSCQEELTDLQAIWSTYQNQDVTIVGVAYDDSPEKVRQTSDRLGLTYPLSLDDSGRLARSYGVTGVPEVFVIDPMGLVAHVHIGPVSRATLRAEIDDLLSHAK